MEQPGLHGRHRDKNSEISRKHGNTVRLTRFDTPSCAGQAWVSLSRAVKLRRRRATRHTYDASPAAERWRA